MKQSAVVKPIAWTSSAMLQDTERFLVVFLVFFDLLHFCVHTSSLQLIMLCSYIVDQSMKDYLWHLFFNILLMFVAITGWRLYFLFPLQVEFTFCFCLFTVL